MAFTARSVLLSAMGLPLMPKPVALIFCLLS
jgi:hypothetical protein